LVWGMAYTLKRWRFNEELSRKKNPLLLPAARFMGKCKKKKSKMDVRGRRLEKGVRWKKGMNCCREIKSKGCLENRNIYLQKLPEKKRVRSSKGEVRPKGEVAW